jgi:hypothetical protein
MDIYFCEYGMIRLLMNSFLELVRKDRRGKKMKFKKILYACIMGGILFMLLGCNPRSSRAYLEKRIGTEMSRVYPTERLENLFDQFPGGFKITQSFMDGDDLFTVEIIARSKGEPISGTVSKVGDNGIDKIFETNFQYQDGKYQFANETDAAYWPYRGFLFEKLTLNREILSKLDLQEKFYSMMNGDFELRYKVTDEIINSFLGLGDSDSLSVSLVGSNSNRGYYYSIAIENAEGLYFRETVSD